MAEDNALVVDYTTIHGNTVENAIVPRCKKSDRPEKIFQALAGLIHDKKAVSISIPITNEEGNVEKRCLDMPRRPMDVSQIKNWLQDQFEFDPKASVRLPVVTGTGE